MATKKKTRSATTSKAKQPRDPATHYAKLVTAGTIIAGPWVREACARHLHDLKHGARRGLVWDLKAALRAINFFPEVLRLAEGEHAGRPFELELWQKFIVGSLFGWKVKIGVRRFRTAYIEIGKGNGKTPLAAGIGIYMLVADGEHAAECYAAAVSRDQAAILFRDADLMVDASPALTKRIRKSGDQHVYNLAFLEKRSFFRPISSEGRGLDGKRVHYAALDEIHEHRTPVVVDKMRAGTKGRRQALIVEITNSGYDRESVCWHHHQYSCDVLKARSKEDKGFNDTWFAYVCALDEGDQPFVDEKCWIKANPNLGVSIHKKYLREQADEAIGMPSKQAIVLRLNFCVWTEAENPWIDYERWKACQATLDFDSLRGRKCYLAIDLSSKLDLSAVAGVFEADDGSYDAFVEFWSPADTMAEREMKDVAPYRLWRTQGHLHAVPGRSVDYAYVTRRLGELSAQYEILGAAYDRWRIDDLKRELDADGIELALVEFGQGFKHMAPAVDATEELVVNGQIRIHANPVLNWCSASAVIESDAAGNRKFTKRKSTGRIDGIVALTMAIGMVKRQQVQGPSVYETRGLLELNV